MYFLKLLQCFFQPNKLFFLNSSSSIKLIFSLSAIILPLLKDQIEKSIIAFFTDALLNRHPSQELSSNLCKHIPKVFCWCFTALHALISDVHNSCSLAMQVPSCRLWARVSLALYEFFLTPKNDLIAPLTAMASNLDLDMKFSEA